jgi:hypothetical protein
LEPTGEMFHQRKVEFDEVISYASAFGIAFGK